MTPALSDRDREMMEDYGFGPVVPCLRYAPAAVGRWTMASRRGGLSEGYVALSCIDAPYHAMVRDDGEEWMSSSMLETESHAWHLHRAAGDVVVGGLGMAMFAHAAAMKPEVERVVVVDVDPEIPRLLDLSAPGWRHPKMEILIHDVAEASLARRVREALGRDGVDYLYMDIWLDYPDPEAPGLTGRLARDLGAREAGWWGQEAALAFATGGVGLDEDGCRRFFEGVGVPVRVDDGYVRFCNDVALAHGMEPAAPGPR